MADQRLSVHDRVLAIDHLEQMARDLNLMAVWLAEADCETEGDMTNDAAKALLGAAVAVAADEPATAAAALAAA